jgi:hypothetical protein
MLIKKIKVYSKRRPILISTVQLYRNPVFQSIVNGKLLVSWKQIMVGDKFSWFGFVSLGMIDCVPLMCTRITYRGS